MDALPRRPSLPLKVLTISTRALLWLMLLAWLLFGAAWAALHLLIVPRIGELRPLLETRASEALGLPVRIGGIVAHGDSRLLPSFELQEVLLFDRAGEPALYLPRVQATVSPRSLWNLGFEQLAIDRPELEVRRSAEGRLYVAGIEINPQDTGDNRVLDWVFSQTEWVITGGRVHWHDALRGAPPVELQQVDLRLHNSSHLHELRLDARPPAELGGLLSLRGSFREPLLFADAGDWRRWQGQLYAVLERVDLAELNRHIPLPAQLQLDLAAGSGALRTWVEMDRGQVKAVTADVALSQLNLRLGPALPALELDRLTARLGLRRLEGGYELSTQGLNFETRDGLQWRGGDLRLSQVQPAAGSERGELRVSGFDLAQLARLGQRLPLGARLHRALQIYDPRGQVEQLQARWQGSWEAPQTFDARGRLSRLEVASHTQLQPLAEGEPPADAMGSPGVRGLTVEFDFNQDAGRASVLVQDGHLELPGVFEQPRIELAQLAADLQWRRQGGQTSLQINNARFANAETQGEFQLKWHTGSGAQRLPGVIDLQGSLGRAELAALHRYLPRAIPAEVRDYLREALPQGRASAARFRVKGDLHDFPFSQPGQGEFRITAQVHDTRFVYVPASLQGSSQKAWPALAELRGDLVLDRSSLQLRNIGARVDGVPQLRILQGEARIPDMTRDTRVQTDLQLSGPLDDLLRGLIISSPLDAMLGGVLGQARATGNAEVQLRLDLPLQELERSRVRGQIKLAGNELQLMPQLPRLTRARGAVHFSEQGFALAGVQGRLFGGDVRAEGGTMAVPGTASQAVPRLRVQGTFTAQGLRQETQLGALAALAQQMNGSTSYSAEFGLRQGVPEFQFYSSLQGLALKLPAPLAKPAETTLPLRLHSALQGVDAAAGGATARQDLLRFDLGQLLSLRYVRQHGSEGVQVLRGAIGVGQPAGEVLALPDEGVIASVQFDEFDLDAWRRLLAQPGGSATGNAGLPATLHDYLPTSLNVQGQTLHAGGQTFRQLVAGGTREGRIWRASIDAREFSGYFEYRMPAQTGAGNVYARLARLVLAQDNARGVEQLLDEQPVGIPALDVVIDSLELRGKNLGRVEIEAVNRGLARRDAGAREWRLSRLAVLMPEAEFTASGNWAVYQEAGEPTTARTAQAVARGERRRTVMNFQLEVHDAGGLLSRLGMPGLIRAGKGRMEGQASWVGSPLGLDYPTLGGGFNINIEQGQFLKADPGLAKLLGVLSLQSLPRRLTLDFRDVFSEGFAFDFVRGDVKIEQGMANTNNLQMKGVSAAVLMSGQADLARETQDLRVVVVPEINAGTASLVATWINPAVGLGTFLAQYFLRRPAMAAATQEFRLTGTWAEPQMNRVETARSTPAPAETGSNPP